MKFHEVPIVVLCLFSSHGCSAHYFLCCFDLNLNFHSIVVCSIRIIMMLRVLKRSLPIWISFFVVHTSLNCGMYVGAWLSIFSILCTAEAVPLSRTHTFINQPHRTYNQKGIICPYQTLHPAQNRKTLLCSPNQRINWQHSNLLSSKTKTTTNKKLSDEIQLDYQ